jgi:hypothetical protein
MFHNGTVLMIVLMLASAVAGFIAAMLRSISLQATWHLLGYDAGLSVGHTAGMQEGADAAAAQIAGMTETQRAFNEMKPEMDEIALYLREFYKDEIALGYHAGRKFGAIVTGYLAVERKLSARLEANLEKDQLAMQTTR